MADDETSKDVPKTEKRCYVFKDSSCICAIKTVKLVKIKRIMYSNRKDN